PDQSGAGDSPIRTFRRTDVQTARLHYEDGEQVDFAVRHVDLYFFYDMDVVILVLEIHADNLPLHRVQDTLYRFGRAFPAGWETDGSPSHCMRNVQWLDASGAVLAESDFRDRQKYLSFTGEHRSARVGAHWKYLLEPMVSHHSSDAGLLRYRQLEYLRMPKISFLAVDDPFALGAQDFMRLALGSSPDDAEAPCYSPAAIESFKRDYFFDRFWAPDRQDTRASTRVSCTGDTMVMVGSAAVPWFVDGETGMLGQFRHQYFLIALIPHFHKAALLLLSDRLVSAVTRLDVDDAESLYRFKLEIRQSLEVFLRFNHRYWFHEVSNQAMARRLYAMFGQHLGTEALFNEVREEVLDMSEYLDSDDSRRQGDAVLRLTVVTIFGLIGTIVTGFLGMNLIDESDKPLAVKMAIFVAVLVPSIVLTLLAVYKSNALSEVLDTLGNSRLGRRERLAMLRRLVGRRRVSDG
ncbi:MAG TPA: CorA family divalent cation transporter, partial [Burkholderiaceae bacterium]|nr:CorA family divalent cation transporter [Burkholderiaceae bacterium]